MDSALILAGEGYGNLIMATPVMRALIDLGYQVDALVECNWEDAGTLLLDTDVRSVYTSRTGAVAMTQYDVAVRTTWAKPRGLLRARRWLSCPRCDFRVSHEIDANLAALEPLGYVGPLPAPFCTRKPLACDLRRFKQLAGPKSRPFDWNAPYRVICPGWGGRDREQWRRKAWPHWKELIEAEPDAQWLAVGAKRDWEPWMEEAGLCAAVGLPISMAAGILKGAECVISVDNGLAHIAGALGVKTVVLFGATSEVKSAPRGPGVRIVTADIECRPCQLTGRWRDCRDWKCMSAIGADRIRAAIAMEAEQ